jgi:hypothetical protein
MNRSLCDAVSSIFKYMSGILSPAEPMKRFYSFERCFQCSTWPKDTVGIIHADRIAS